MILLHKNDLSAPTIRLIYRSKSSLRASSPGRSGGGKGKGRSRRRACNYVSGIWIPASKKSMRKCEILSGGDDISNDVITLGTCFSMFVLHSRSFPLHADWRKSDSSVDGEPQGNWRRNSNSGDVVASSPTFSRPAARAPWRACSQVKANRNNANHLTRVLFLSHFCIYDSKQIQCSFRYWMCLSIDWLPQFDSLVNFSDNCVKSVCFLWGTKELNFQINVMQHKNVTKLWFYGILDQRWGWFTDHLKTCGWRDEQRRR